MSNTQNPLESSRRSRRLPPSCSVSPPCRGTSYPTARRVPVGLLADASTRSLSTMPPSSLGRSYVAYMLSAFLPRASLGPPSSQLSLHVLNHAHLHASAPTSALLHTSFALRSLSLEALETTSSPPRRSACPCPRMGWPPSWIAAPNPSWPSGNRKRGSPAGPGPSFPPSGSTRRTRRALF